MLWSAATPVAVVSVSERRATRLVGIDVARCLALLGMIATHVSVARDPDGSLSTLQWLAGGRASALFAVLAGVSLALVSGRRTPVAGRKRVRVSLAISVRSLSLVLIGLALAEIGTGVAVILAYYGVLFVLALPFLGLGARALLGLAVVWAVAVPLASHVVRPMLPDRQFANPDLDQLAAPGRLLSELLLTGYYPALPWVAYVLLGLGLGRLDLARPGIQARLVVVGLAVAAGATLVSGVLTRAVGFTDAELDAVAGGMFGQTPTDSWHWLLVVAPHSTTPFDLLQTGGSATLVISACLLVVGRVRATTPDAERAVAIFFGAGTMTLTLYVLHVVLRETVVTPDDDRALLWHVVIMLWLGALFVALGRRGPLEWLVGIVPARIRGRGP